MHVAAATVLSCKDAKDPDVSLFKCLQSKTRLDANMHLSITDDVQCYDSDDLWPAGG